MKVNYLILITTLLLCFTALSCVHGGPVNRAEAIKAEVAPESLPEDKTPSDW